MRSVRARTRKLALGWACAVGQGRGRVDIAVADEDRSGPSSAGSRPAASGGHGLVEISGPGGKGKAGAVGRVMLASGCAAGGWSEAR